MSNDFRERYQRQLLLPEVGEKGQILLAQKRVCGWFGAGGLGCTLLPLLVGSGVGHLVICDNDVVSLSNLPRQTLYTVPQIGQSKAQLAAGTSARYQSRLRYSGLHRTIGGAECCANTRQL